MEATLSLPATSEVKKDYNKGRDCCFKRTTDIAFQIKKCLLVMKFKKQQNSILKIWENKYGFEYF